MGEQEEMETVPVQKSSFQPLVDKVGVPLLWLALGFGLGYVLASRNRPQYLPRA